MTLIPGYPGATGLGSQDQLRAEWAAGIDPQAMLIGLRKQMSDGPSAAQARALCDFAVLCSRRVLSTAVPLAAYDATRERVHAARLLNLAERRADGGLTDEKADAVRQLSVPVARGASEQLLDPAMRREAARLLSAFHALDPDPFGAAVQAAGMAERFRARDEHEAAVLRTEQGTWLRELFGAAILAPTAPPVPAVGAWPEKGSWVSTQASRMRYLVRFRAALLARDPWIAVPQNAC